MHSFSLLLTVLTFLAADPEIEGDTELLQVLLQAQQANLDSLRVGEVRATQKTKSKSSSQGAHVVSVHVVWQDDKAYWEFDVKHDQFDTEGKKIDETPMYGRMVFTGTNYALYWPALRGSGQLVIFADPDLAATVPHLEKIDVRPSVRWARLQGIRPWAEILSPHSNLPGQRLEKWTIEAQRKLVTIGRQDRKDEGEMGVSRSVLSLEFAGQVLEHTYKSSKFQKRCKCSWKKDEAGRVILEKEWICTEWPDRTSEQELVIRDFEPNPTIRPGQFELGALQVRRGAVVDDRIQGKRYTYGGRNVDQQILDSLSKQVQERRKPM